MSITPEMVINKYLEDREKIRAIRKAAETQVEAIEASQKRREDYLLQLKEPSIFSFMVDLYINGRDGKAVAEAKKKDLGLQMNEIERWLLHMLDSQKVTGIKTEFGTVFPTRKESVSVDDFDALIEFSIIAPIAHEIAKTWLVSIPNVSEAAVKDVQEKVEAIIKSSAHFEYLNKAVNKTSVLEQMGDLDAKSNSRPNPAPPGVKYTAIRTVGVRKGKE